MTERKAHPVADLFPMLDGDELDELAADIAERGLVQAIVLDAEGQILDGRNRLAACQLAKVQPTFETYEGDDPAGYALAVNVQRRHMSTGARAIVIEQARRLTGAGQRATARDSNLSQARMWEAGLVLDWAPSLVPGILAGDALSVAVTRAREIKSAAAELEAKRDRIRKDAPDLAILVADEQLTLDDAIAALDARVTKAEAEEAARQAQARRDRDDGLRAAEAFSRRMTSDVVTILGGRQMGAEIELGPLIEAASECLHALREAMEETA